MAERENRGRNRRDRDEAPEFADRLVAINRVSKTVKGGKRFGFAFAKANAAFLVANNHQSSEAKALTTFNGFRHTVDRNQAICKFRGLFAVATTSPAVFTFCHQNILSKVARFAPMNSILVSGVLPDHRGRVSATHRV